MLDIYIKEFYCKFDGILTDSQSLVKSLETNNSLYTNIPIDDAINCIKELVLEFADVIQNADFVIELFKHNSFNGEFFHQFFGVIMGTNVAPILANVYLTKLGKNLKDKCKTD